MSDVRGARLAHPDSPRRTTGGGGTSDRDSPRRITGGGGTRDTESPRRTTTGAGGTSDVESPRRTTTGAGGTSHRLDERCVMGHSESTSDVLGLVLTDPESLLGTTRRA